jgi:hypothetical protein
MPNSTLFQSARSEVRIIAIRIFATKQPDQLKESSMSNTIRFATFVSPLTLGGFASSASSAELKVVASFSIIADFANIFGCDRES